MKKQTQKQKKRKALQRRRALVLGGTVLAVLLVVFCSVYFVQKSAVNKVPKDTVCNNVYVENIDVSGMKEEEVKAALEAKLAEYQSETVSLLAEGTKAEVTLGELGFSLENVDELVEKVISYGKEGSVWSRYRKIKDLEKESKLIEASYVIDTQMVQSVLEEKLPALENAAKDASLSRKDGKFIITDGVEGKKVDAEQSIKTIEAYFNKDWKNASGEIELVTMMDEPDVTSEDLEQVKDVLGKFTTYCGSGGGRVQNIVTGCGLINGAVIMPGEEYSADAAMRPYTYENGFTTAGSYENGQVVQSMGGGICQVSSTLYNAVILAELEVTQRQPHSMLVDYVNPSMDAAIAGDYKDLKFKNSTDAPIYLEGVVSGGYITFTIYGKETRAAGREIEYISETTSTKAAEKRYSASDAALGVISKTGSGHTGMEARTWKVVYQDGEEISREVFNKSSYISSPATYTVGTATDNAEAKAVVVNAIKSNDESKIKAAIDQAKSIIKAAEDKKKAEAQKPETPAPAPETPAPEAPTPETPAPETPAPETPAPEAPEVVPEVTPTE